MQVGVFRSKRAVREQAQPFFADGLTGHGAARQQAL
jgi:hypothetical protein